MVDNICFCVDQSVWLEMLTYRHTCSSVAAIGNKAQWARSDEMIALMVLRFSGAVHISCMLALGSDLVISGWVLARRAPLPDESHVPGTLGEQYVLLDGKVE